MNSAAPEHSHLDESVRAVAADSDLARAQFILKDWYFQHPAAQRIEQFLEILYHAPDRIRCKRPVTTV